jgi:hypothetical protein
MKVKRCAAVLAPVLAVTLAACSHAAPPKPLPPLILGSAPATPTGHIKTNQPLDSYTGYVGAYSWPSACDLITDQDIRSIFPQATGRIQHKVGEQKFQFPDGNEFDVPNAQCSISFHLPTNDEAAVIGTSIEAIGDPDLVRENGETDRDAVRNCAYRAGFAVYVCGRIEVSAGIDQLPLQMDTATGTVDRYQVAGKITTFTVKQYDAEDKFMDTHINEQLIRATLSKLPK